MNVVFWDGAQLSVDMSEIDDGGINRTYNLVDSESRAEVVVMFSFQDDTQFHVYLQVTSVNS